MRGLIVTSGELSEWTGLSPREIEQCVRNGCPVQRTGEKGSRLQFNTAEFFEWHAIHEADKQGASFGENMRQFFEMDRLRRALDEERKKRSA